MSDRSLREALGKLADDWDALNCSQAAAWSRQTKDQVEGMAQMCAGDLRAALEDHPAEPAPDRESPDAAVEALTASMFESVHEMDWSMAEGVVRAQWLKRGRAALEAAYRVDAPRPQEPTADAVDALLWAHRAVASNGTQTVCACDRDWRSDTEHRAHLRNAVLALLNGAE